MTKLIFATLALTAIIWGARAVLRQSRPGQPAVEETEIFGDRGAWLVGHACSPPHVVIAGAALIGRGTVRATPGQQSEEKA